MAFSEINDHDAEQIGGGAIILISREPKAFTPNPVRGYWLARGANGVGYSTQLRWSTVTTVRVGYIFGPGMPAVM